MMGQVFTEGSWIQSQELRAGDEFQFITKTKIVDHVQSWHDGTSTVYVEAPKGAPNATEAFLSSEGRFILRRKAPRTPENWPPQRGDVWTDGVTEVHVVSSGIYDADGGMFPNTNHLIRNHPQMKLVYRRGNEPRH